jgi:putative phage-type endonuclease
MLIQFDSHEEWLAARLEGYRITASMVPQILGVSPYGGAYDVWARHHEPDTVEAPTGAQLQLGLDDEPRALAEYARLQGVLVQHGRDCMFIHDEHPWAAASPDGLVSHVGGVEVKHFDHPNWSDWAPTGAVWSGESDYPIPAFVAIQALWTMYCSGRQWWDVVAVLPSGRRYPDTRVYTIMRHEPTIRQIVETVTAWREKHLVGGERPPYDSGAQHYTIVGKRHPRAETDTVLEADDETAAMLARYAELVASSKSIEDEIDGLKGKLAEIVGENKGLRGPAGSVSWGTPSMRSSLSLSKVESEAPDILEQLKARGLVTIAETARPWRFTPKKPKKPAE